MDIIFDDIDGGDASKGMYEPSVDLPNLGLKTAQNQPRAARACPECGSDCLDMCMDSKGEVFLLCLSCINLFPKFEDITV